jgi:hypothetical protein
MYGAQTLSVLLMIFIFYKVVIVSLVRDKALSPNALFLLALVTCAWQDPIVNYFAFSFSYNAYYFNLGSWCHYIPGWFSPNTELFAEPLLLVIPIYFWMGFGWALGSCWFFRKLFRWKPNLHIVEAFLLVLLVTIVVDTLVETIMLRAHTHAYLGAVRGSFTLFSGEIYQFPLYEALAVGLWTTLMGVFLYYRDNQGYSFVERGINDINAPKPFKTTLRWLALVGILNVIMFFGFNFTHIMISTHADKFPRNVPSYFNNGICGEGTPYNCPGPGIPLPRR